MSELKHHYFILAPDYRESSGGIQALHKLCHRINLRGGVAWMAGCKKTNPEWNTPIASLTQIQEYISKQQVPIAVYPEVVSGNPLNAEVCVRYMLNHEGLLNGNRLNESTEDLFFWYSSQLIVKEPSVDFLTMVGPDLNLFFDDGREKTLNLLYLNRIPESAIDFTRLPADVEIISIQQARPLKELAEILKSARVMYTFEWSGTCNLAALCGAPVVSLVLPGYEKLAISSASIRDMGGAGVCYSDTNEDLEKTRSELYKVREHMNKFEAGFEHQLTHFFNKTQDAARLKKQIKYPTISEWIDRYPVPLNCTPHAISLAVIVVGAYDEKRIAMTMESIQQCESIDLWIACNHPNFDTEEFGLINDKLHHWLEHCDKEWVVFLRPGDLLQHKQIALLSLFHQQVDDALAFNSDRIVCTEEGEQELFLPDFNLDALLSYPDTFARGNFFRRSLCMAILTERKVNTLGIELDMLLQLVNANASSKIKHIPLIMLKIKPAKHGDHQLCNTLILEHLHMRGYTNAEVLTKSRDVLSIKYNHHELKKLSVVIICDTSIGKIQKLIASFVDTAKGIDYELLIIENKSQDDNVRPWLSSLEKINPNVFRIFFCEEKLAEVALFNQGSMLANGDMILLINTDIYMENNQWLQAMINHINRPEVFSCGPTILQANMKYHSAGLIGGINQGWAAQGAGELYGNESYASRLLFDQSLMLLDAKCILLKKEGIISLGGLDSDYETFEAAICDILIRADVQGCLNIFTPHAAVYIQKNNSRAVAYTDYEMVYARWMRKLVDDTSYNINLRLSTPLFQKKEVETLNGIQSPSRLDYLFLADSSNSVEIERYETLAVRSCSQSSAVISRQVYVPELYQLRPMNLVINETTLNQNPDILLIRQTDLAIRVMVEVTEAGFENEHNYHSQLQFADSVVVRNAAMADIIEHPNIVIWNDKLKACWRINEPSIKPDSGKPRVGIMLDGLEKQDWSFLESLIVEMQHSIDWIIYGACPDNLKKNIHEYHRKVPQDRLQQVLCSLHLDVALAPLEKHVRNLGKGHLDVIQLGACGYPVISSDAAAYQEVTNTLKTKNKTSQWRHLLIKLLQDEALRVSMAQKLQAEIFTRWINYADV